MRTPALPATLLAAVISLLAAPQAHAGLCASRSAASDMKAAELVFVGRAGKPRVVGKHRVQHLEVLHVLKGRTASPYILRRTNTDPLSDVRSFRHKEVALVFVAGGAVRSCGGNTGIIAQLARLARYLAASTVPTAPPDLAAMRAALATALKRQLRGRSSLSVYYRRLAGKQVRIGKSTLRFGKRRSSDAVVIRTALRSGPLLFVTGRYPLRSYRFRVLLKRGKRGYETLVHSGGSTRLPASRTPSTVDREQPSK